MSPYVWLFAAWGLVTGAFVVLWICRSRVESKETDWIPLTEDAREERAIQEQKVLEKKAHKFDWPIRVLGAISVLLLLVAVGFWLYASLVTGQPPPPE